MTNKTLATLTAAALALPALAVQAEENEKKYSISVKHHSYEEDNISAENSIGSQNRYDINANQFRFDAKVSDQFSATVNYQTETMSGASPWYTIKNGDGDVVQVMSGASIKDKRTDLSINTKYKLANRTFGLTAARSDEDDYESLSFGASFEQESEDKLSTWAIAGDFSNDDLMPVDSNLFTTRPIEGSKHSSSLLASFSRVLNKSTIAQFSVGYATKSGYLSDPYKMVFVDNLLVADSRPEDRKATTFSARLRYFSEPLNGALHADYRFYDDDWEIKSHTIDLSWYQNLGYGVRLVPSVRLYSQTDSYFYDEFYDQARADGFHSTDYRLSEYGALTVSLKLEKKFEDWSVNLQAEEYKSDGTLGLADAEVENPALLDFSLVSVGLTYQF